MEIGVVLRAAEVDGGTSGWASVRSYALAAEQAGLDAVWMFDHLLDQADDGVTRGMYEAWTIVSAVAAITTRVRVGQLVTCTGFRNPGLLAKMAATVDAVSGGRLVLGLGAGWHDPEYTAFGFPSDHKVGRFEEAISIIGPLIRGGHSTFHGRWHDTHDAVLLPPPEHRTPILVAADAPRMRRLTVRHADSWATAWYGMPDATLRSAVADLDDALAQAERAPNTLHRVAGVVIADPAAPPSLDEDPEIIGTPDAIADAIEAYAALGFGELIVNLRPMSDRWLAGFGELVRAIRSH